MKDINVLYAVYIFDGKWEEVKTSRMLTVKADIADDLVKNQLKSVFIKTLERALGSLEVLEGGYCKRNGIVKIV